MPQRKPPLRRPHRRAMVVRMQPLVAALWGAFFGTATLMIAGAVAAYLRDLKRVAVMAASASLLYILFVASYLGLLPMPGDSFRLRFDANLFMFCAVLLGNLVLAMIGHMREPAAARRWRTALYCYGIVVAGTALLLPAADGFALCTAGGF